MTIAYPSRVLLAGLLLALAGGGCSSSSPKSDGSVADASGETRGGSPYLTASRSMLNFPSLCPGGVSTPETVQIMNVGDSAVPVIVKVIGGDAADFVTTQTGCQLVPPGSACTVAVVFAPTTASREVAILEVTTPGGPQITIGLVTGGTGGPAPFTISPYSFDFAGVAVGTDSPAVTYTVTVTGTPGGCPQDAAVTLFVVTLSSPDFVITDDTCSTNVIPIGGTCTLGVVFRPTSAGTKNAFLVVGWPSFVRTLPLIGTGTERVDAALPDPMDSSIDSLDRG